MPPCQNSYGMVFNSHVFFTVYCNFDRLAMQIRIINSSVKFFVLSIGRNIPKPIHSIINNITHLDTVKYANVWLYLIRVLFQMVN